MKGARQPLQSRTRCWCLLAEVDSFEAEEFGGLAELFFDAQ